MHHIIAKYRWYEFSENIIVMTLQNIRIIQCCRLYAWFRDSRRRGRRKSGINPICFKQIGHTDTATQRFQCLQTLLGDWVSINKTNGGVSSKLVLGEVLVFGSKYSCMHYTDGRVLEVCMGPTLGRQDPGGHHLGPMNLAIRINTPSISKSCHRQNI